MKGAHGCFRPLIVLRVNLGHATSQRRSEEVRGGEEMRREKREGARKRVANKRARKKPLQALIRGKKGDESIQGRTGSFAHIETVP